MLEASEELSVVEGYTAWASCYDDDGNPLVAMEGPAVRARLGDLSGVLALDIGCGTGRHTLSLLDAGARVVATDATPAMMDLARAKLAGRPVTWVRHALPEPLPLPDHSVELALMGLVAEHLPDLPAALASVVRTLRPGGRLILTALHPDRTAGGQRARFIDPSTGLRQPITTIHRNVSDYLEIAHSVGLSLIDEQPLIVSPELALTLPRAARYSGLPLGWLGHWSSPVA
ncbi:class I SAM-dependent methyltransferase [Isosphaeraceae bacterium EP7]